MFIAASAAVLVAMFLVLVRACLGPTVYDRIMAVNSIGTLVVILIAVFGFLSGRPEFTDIALIYALMNFISTIAVTKYVKFNDMGAGEGREEQGDI